VIVLVKAGCPLLTRHDVNVYKRFAECNIWYSTQGPLEMVSVLGGVVHGAFRTQELGKF
jgi:hypothetical protein